MDESGDLIARVVRWAAARSPKRLPAPATREQVADAEARLGFALPALLARLYTEVANGGFGPDDWRLYPVERLGSFGDRPDRVVAVMDVGCGLDSVVDCSDPDGPVLLMDPNAYGADEAGAWSLDAPSLAVWLERWLDGSSWLVMQDVDIDEIGWPVPWPDAAARLAAPAACEAP